jgi:hypothetical protein
VVATLAPATTPRIQVVTVVQVEVLAAIVLLAVMLRDQMVMMVAAVLVR